MKNSLSSRFLLFVVFTICVLIVAAVALRSTKVTNPQATQDQAVQVPVVVNETEAFQVESLTSQDTGPNLSEKVYTLKLKNVSGKNIVAWAVQYPSGQMQYVGAAMGGEIVPDEVQTVEIHDVSKSNDSNQPRKITIKLVMFEDGSGEGDFKTHKFITDSRLASKIQTERINAILENALLSRQERRDQLRDNHKEWLDRIISEISELPETAPPGQPSMVIGFRSVKSRTLRLLNGLDEWEETRKTDPVRASGILKRSVTIFGSSDLSDGVTKVIRYNEKLIGKHKAQKGESNEK